MKPCSSETIALGIPEASIHYKTSVDKEESNVRENKRITMAQ